MAAERTSRGAANTLGALTCEGIVVASLALAALVLCWPLGLTNRILAGVDAFTYFTPYWAYRAAELQAGRLPLWNPYLFTGVPFLANPQAAVLYPLHWPLIWLPSVQALVWSALMHVWLAALLMYAYARQSLGLRRSAAWLAGALFGFGGFTLARIENINQLNALAWLPGLLWFYDETRWAGGWRRRLRWGGALAVVMALQLLAGHTQTSFINMVGLGLYAAWPAAAAAWRSIRDWLRHKRHGVTADEPADTSARPGPEPFGRALARLLPLLAVVPAALLTAAQLLPTLELNGLGLRTGGLTYRLAVSFSLEPRLLLQTLLPPFGGGLAETFGSESYAEFVGFVGITGLILAVLGVLSLRRRRDPHTVGLIVLAAAGFLLALGAYDPAYYLLWRFVPGFDLFRAPARWLALYAVAAAGLAGVGLDAWLGEQMTADRSFDSTAAMSPRDCKSLAQVGKPPQGLGLQRLRPLFSFRRRLPVGDQDRYSGNIPAKRPTRHPIVFGWLGIGLALVLVALIAVQRFPDMRTVLGWAGAGLLAAVLLLAGRRWAGPARAGLIVLALAELWLGGRALPFTLATAPAALSLRNAPAALLAATSDQPPAGRDRFLSMSDIRYDPGDLAELRALEADRLPADAVERFVRAAKWAEVIAPNLSMLWRLPAIDGYDGGLLPTADYGKLLALFLPPEQRLPDGRLREQLQAIPSDRLLDLTGVRFIITDKQRDLWAGDVYYDLEQPVPLPPGQTLTLDLAGYPAFSATALGVVAEGNAESQAAAGAEVVVTAADGRTARLPLSAAPAPPDQPPQPIILALPQPLTPATITMRVPAATPAGLTLHGLSLIDQRTGAHESITLSPRGDLRRIHSGDVKIYERTAAPGRAWLVHGVQPAADEATTLRLLADPAFDPRSSAVVEGPTAARPAAAAGESVTVVAAVAERIELHATAQSPALLMLADAFYPGWEAQVDGTPAPILRANLMFRAVALTPGTHEVVFAYHPASVRVGAIISLAALTMLMGCILATFVPNPMHKRASAV